MTGLVQCANSLVAAEVSEVKGAKQLPTGGLRLMSSRRGGGVGVGEVLKVKAKI